MSKLSVTIEHMIRNRVRIAPVSGGGYRIDGATEAAEDIEKRLAIEIEQNFLEISRTKKMSESAVTDEQVEAACTTYYGYPALPEAMMRRVLEQFALSTRPQVDVELVAALKAARQFIENGVALGFIRMPDATTPDPAHNTLPMICAALAKAAAPAPPEKTTGARKGACDEADSIH